MSANPATLIDKLGLLTPLVGLYDAPDPEIFAPLIRPVAGRHRCIFSFYEDWLEGRTLLLEQDNSGCGGAAYWLFGETTRSREELVQFLVEDEGLKASHTLMNRWLDRHPPYRRRHPHLLLGPLRPEGEAYLRTVTFFVNPDQLSALILGANYEYQPGERPAVLAPFGSGCMEMLPLFENLGSPQAMIGATDLAMRRSLPPDLLAFTVTLPMFARLCDLDEKSFLNKSFWANLRRARAEIGEV